MASRCVHLVSHLSVHDLAVWVGYDLGETGESGGGMCLLGREGMAWGSRGQHSVPIQFLSFCSPWRSSKPFYLLFVELSFFFFFGHLWFMDKQLVCLWENDERLQPFE